MSFPRYPAYKKTASCWFDMIPTHWDTSKLKWYSDRYSGGTPDKNRQDYWLGGTIPWLNSGAVNDGLISEPSTFITEGGFANSSAKWVPSGSLVMALAGQGKTKGTVAQLAIDATTNQSMAAIVPRNMLAGRFLYWWLASNYQNIRNMSGGDDRDGLNLELLGSIPIPLLKQTEQEQIARFLDRETAKIDALVAEQEQLITLLKEKRQAVISHAVTKGLDPSVPMKDSGVEWLGEVPEHWWPTTLRRCTRSVETGGTPSITPSIDEVEDGVNWFTPGDFNEGLNLEKSDRQIPAAAIESGDAKAFPAGAVLIVSIGATLGKVGLIMQDASANQQINAVIPAAGINSLFLAFSLSVRVDTMKFLSNASTIGIMNQEKTKEIPVAIPPESEQVDIADYLTRSCVRFDALINEATSTMTLLQERRSALISAAVTGQIDVRGLAPALEQAA